MKNSMHSLAVLCLSIGLSASLLQADDWPTYLRSNDRVGASPEQLTLPLSAA